MGSRAWSSVGEPSGNSHRYFRFDRTRLGAPALLHYLGSKVGKNGADGEMLRGHVQLSKIGGQLKLANLSKHVTMLLQVTSLNKVFEIFDNELDDIKSFVAASAAKSTS
jgi:hypothetical protein